MQLYNPKYRDMPIKEIEMAVNFDKEWKPFGYTDCALCRDTGTVYVFKRNTVQKEELVWLISSYGFLLCRNGKVLTSGDSFARHIQLGTNQEEPRNREAVRIAKNLNDVGRFETDHSGTAVSFIHYIK